jgi:subtilisin family serine protease
VVLPPVREDQSVRALHFYRLGVPSSVRSNPRNYDDPNVRELVNLVNLDVLAGERGGDTGSGWSVVAATPDWLASGADDGWTFPGPGARPEPVRPDDVPGSDGGRWRFRFSNPDLGELVESAREGGTRSNVTVAILDTSPLPRDVERAAKAFPKNSLFQDIRAGKASGGIVVDHVPPPAPGAGGTAGNQALPGAFLSQVVPDWRLDKTRRPRDLATRGSYKMPDHGLFALGIIHDIAPGAKIYLVRALGDRGVGTLGALVDLLERLRAQLKPSRERPLVVNLSLVIAMPPGVELLKEWLPATYARLARQLTPFLSARRNPKPDVESALRDLLGAAAAEDLIRFLNMLHEGLFETIASLKAQWTLVVAAAGNEHNPALGDPFPPEPCWPARYQEAFGVAAVAADAAESAEYSNRGDVRALGNGVAVFGGQARRNPPGNQPMIDLTPPPTDVDAIRGLFSARRLPIRRPGERRDNETGWVYWVGTSFAAPVISGIAAAYWADRRGQGLDPDQLMAAIRDHGEPLGSASDPNGPLDCPTIRAYQEFEPVAGP